MRRLALTLTLALLLVFNPGIVFTADANPGKARVDKENTVLTVVDGDDLALPVDADGLTVQYAEAKVPHRAGVAGVTWVSGLDPEHVFIREVRAGGTPGEWSAVEVDPADPEEPDNGKAGTDPWVVTGARMVQVATLSEEPLDGSVTVFASPDTEAPAAIGVTKAEAATDSYAWSNPQILSRQAWSANESLVRYAYTYAQVTGAMVHHTAGSNTYTEADVPGILRSIQAYHVTGRGWNDIAYNFLVDKFGRAWEGRGGGVDKAVQGGHAWGLTNARTTGVSMIGNLDTVAPSAAMMDATERVIAWKFALHGVDPYGSTYGSGGQDGGSTFLNAISGHRDENATSCPGTNVYSQMSTIRSKVAAYKPQYLGGAATAPTASAGADQTVAAGQTVTLDGSKSSTSSTYAWKQTAGPSVTLSGATTVKPTFKPTQTGTYTFQLTVTRSGLSATDAVTVTVQPAGTTNLARSSGVVVTASSQDSSTSSTAAKAVDGVISGYPTDETKEWTTLAGKAGSWIQLAFPSPVSVSRVVLYDRPNTNDQVTAGQLSFSDGSSVNVGALANDGSATSVTFTARTVTSVRFTATAVASTTENIGLAEFEVWGTTSGAPAPSPTATATAPANRPPTANAGADQSVTTGTLVTLNGSGSDPDAGTTLRYTWAKTSGPAASLSSTSVARPTFTPASAGTYVFELTVSDGTASARDSVTVTVTAPVTPPSGTTNVARASGVTVTASSQASSQPASRAVDGVASGYPADYTKEWATVGGKASSWIQLAFAAPVSVSKVVLYDRPNANDRVNGGTLTFSDGSTVAVPALDNAGGATTVSFAARTVTSVRFTVTSVASTTENVGLAEFEVWGTASGATTPPTTPPAPAPTEGNLARASGVTATASSQATNQTAAKAIDGVASGYPADYTKEWATVGGKASSWINLAFPAPVTLSRVVLYDRPNTNDRVNGGTLTFSDGSTVAVPALDNAGGATTVTFSGRRVTSVRFTVTSVASTTENVGLAELQAWGVAG